uniref:N-acetylmuramoyl-L-alanine amidase n=1 Tax=uncultured Allobacillus sp. TaxID=1638025 RepID=UPI002591B6D2|nr:N-acetylmuramoyl-L-alanine amidase [uncultured Allobacillus sp.]
MTKWIQDAGHGGSDTGAFHDGVAEKEWSLEAALYVNQRLNELGVSSTVTRKSDRNLSRDERTAAVSKYEKAISHHFNAGGGSGAELIHSIYADGSFEKNLRQKFEEAGYPFRRIFTKTYPGNRKRDYYYMNRETGSARVTIVEYGFLDGPNLHRLKDKNYREGLYECVVQAICAEEGVPYRQASQEPTDKGTTLYRVVTGSFHKRENAEKRIEQLEKAGYEAFIDILRK